MVWSGGTTSRNSSPDIASASHSGEDDDDDGDPQRPHASRGRTGDGRHVRYVFGRSHRSTRSVTSKNTMLAATTKQIAP